MKIEEKEAEQSYNLMARGYHNTRTKKHPQGWFYNEMLEMPATLKLLGNVKGKKILDFGCGTGIYAKLLTRKGAKVKGFDISKEMVKIAKEENPKLDLKIGSGYKIPFKEKFDVVLASLVMHYLSDWDKVFNQVGKVLKKNGIFIFSTGNPVTECRKSIMRGKEKIKLLGTIKVKGKKIKVLGDYFTKRKINEDWIIKDKKVGFSFYHITYETIIQTIIKNRFEIIDYKDCFPIKKSKKLFPKDYAACSKIPIFAVWKVRKR
ncbi:MAG: class I SAM-dependent methyltransferase [bacterium]